MPRVLVVEDHADSRDAIAQLLQRVGYEVISAKDGREALTAVIDRTPDVMLLDLALPELDGVKLVHLVRSYHRLSSIPVVVLTGLSGGKLFEEAKLLKVSSLLVKTLASTDQILSAIRRAFLQSLSSARIHTPEKWRGNNISPL
jgi:chemosensory pili system protein ChpA (sensor histidine kinase/response regulator)